MVLTLVAEIFEAERDELVCCVEGVFGGCCVALCDILEVKFSIST